MRILSRMYEQRWGYYFILPAYLFFSVFTLYPLVMGLRYSFFDVKFTGNTWVGLKHFMNLFNDSVFWQAYTNTLLIVLVSVPLICIVSLLISSAVFSFHKQYLFFVKFSFYLPVVAGGVVLAFVWQWMLNPSFGMINYIMSWFGIPGVEWLNTPNMALASITFILITFSLGQPIILYLAGIGAISKELYEAAMIDGANSFRRFFNITVPLLKPTTLFVIVTQTIANFQIFSLIFLLTRGGPVNGTQTIVFRMYQTAFDQINFGYASAMGGVLIATVSVITFVIFKMFASDSKLYR